MNIQTLDLNLLRILFALLQERSTVKAGARVGLSQPAVSAALGRLRESLGDPLFIRQGQRIVPTDFAKSLELPLQRMYEDLDALLKRAEAFDPTTSSVSFMISGTDFFGDLLMPSLAKILSSHAPQMRIQLTELQDPEGVNDLENVHIDLTLRPKMDFPEWVEYVPVFKSEYVMIAREGHPALADAGVLPGDVVPMDLFCSLGHMLMSMRGNLRGLGDDALAQMGRERRVVMTTPSFSGVYNAVSKSDLVALIPHQLAESIGPRIGLSIYNLPMKVDPVTICMIWHRRRTASSAHQWLRETVMNIMTPLNRASAPAQPVSARIPKREVS